MCGHSNESHSAVDSFMVLFMLCKVILNSKSLNETLVRDHSNESY